MRRLGYAAMAAFGGALVAMTIGIGCTSKASVTPADGYTSVNIGDSEDQVRAKVGSPFTTLGRSPSTWVYSDDSGTDSLRVLVDSGKVVDVCLDKTDASGTKTTCKGTIGL